MVAASRLSTCVWASHATKSTVSDMDRTPRTTIDEPLADLVRQARDRSGVALDGAHRAFGELYEAHGSQLAAWLSARVVRSDLDEVHQEIWVRVWEKLPNHFDGGNFRAWLYAIARNHLVDSARRRSARRDFGYGGQHEEPDATPPDPDGDEPWEILDAQERGLRLRGCLDKLDSGRRRVIVGRLGGEEYESIADGLGITTAQAQSWLFMAKKLVRQCLEDGER